jgi:hypothetical protein
LYCKYYLDLNSAAEARAFLTEHLKQFKSLKSSDYLPEKLAAAASKNLERTEEQITQFEATSSKLRKLFGSLGTGKANTTVAGNEKASS